MHWPLTGMISAFVTRESSIAASSIPRIRTDRSCVWLTAGTATTISRAFTTRRRNCQKPCTATYHYLVHFFFFFFFWFLTNLHTTKTCDTTIVRSENYRSGHTETTRPYTNFPTTSQPRLCYISRKRHFHNFDFIRCCRAPQNAQKFPINENEKPDIASTTSTRIESWIDESKDAIYQ